MYRKKGQLPEKRQEESQKKRDVQALNPKRNRTRMLAISLRARRIIEQQKGLLLSTYRLIKNNLTGLNNGKVITSEDIQIKKIATGEYKGKKNITTLQVKIPQFEFFVKVFDLREEVNILKGVELLENFLKSHNYVYKGKKFKQIRPMLVYEDNTSKKGLLVTPFLKEGEVEQVSHMKKGEKRNEIIKAITSLQIEIEHKHDVWEIAPVNAFYEPKTDTILLFDIYQFMPYYPKIQT